VTAQGEPRRDVDGRRWAESRSDRNQEFGGRDASEGRVEKIGHSASSRCARSGSKNGGMIEASLLLVESMAVTAVFPLDGGSS